ncbi:MAG: bifunctional 4-hydroxy-2-oxoglutarate aldolase/2-dehydro-3-deoxy-phosphogluconate aldolase [Erysipelotrichaceae bacterium]
MKTVFEKLKLSGITPVVVIENSADAADTARALLAGGISTMEITFRTPAARDSIAEVADSVPEMCVGAGTVLNLEQCISALEAGAQFIVSPGFDEEMVKYCLEHDVTIIPGCVTPTDIMVAKKLGLKVVKFFPANVYGGLNGIKALSGPFGDIKFLPTGGINAENVADYIKEPYIFGVGGSWVCTKQDISQHNYERITALSKQAVKTILGYEVAHVGINCENDKVAKEISRSLNNIFDLEYKEGNSSIFVSDKIEVMKTRFPGKNGHIAVKTNRVDLAVKDLESKGCKFDMSTAKYDGENIKTVYIQDEIGGFAINLLQR